MKRIVQIINKTYCSQNQNLAKIISLDIQKTPLLDQQLRNKLLLRQVFTNQEKTHFFLNNQVKQDNQIFKITGNSFFDAFYAAYCLHGEVMISASDIWLSICHKLGQDINRDQQKFEKFFNTSEGINMPTIQIESSVLGQKVFPCKENRWDLILDIFNYQFQRRVQGQIGLLIKNDFDLFSSNLVEQTSANIFLLSQMESNLRFQSCSVCGIQKIHFIGGIEDFEHLAFKIKCLIENNFADWYFNSFFLEPIFKIVNKFIDQMKHPKDIDIQFWNNVFNQKSVDEEYCGKIISEKQIFDGWIKYFFRSELQKEKIPNFLSFTFVPFKDTTQNKDFKLKFSTGMIGIEEVNHNVFRPTTFVKISEVIEN
ncbi:hypothetical protein TTHERM_00310010 (macronuclear) [Tetrahymena thermophila SB210]|uniref:Uncharacterized protein n=1 Tax=Tetrahymena thermophila (strain SB210) TaxID=312017 RepID=I7M2M7_TETTS|nr:hypothetical protein TTHERM_00310010 [Tetrahymena thermophila SB210]EAS00832.1 hypothetical protein TTHERM_00310010 [Tetrahymena thermophila SB210]|eukprot:XP_001021077.1 hypothetical protein TTHERM_00310010 [Tetrahymena thermophila SB210]